VVITEVSALLVGRPIMTAAAFPRNVLSEPRASASGHRQPSHARQQVVITEAFALHFVSEPRA